MDIKDERSIVSRLGFYRGTPCVAVVAQQTTPSMNITKPLLFICNAAV